MQLTLSEHEQGRLVGAAAWISEGLKIEERQSVKLPFHSPRKH